jgi:hypothetical protein
VRYCESGEWRRNDASEKGRMYDLRSKTTIEMSGRPLREKHILTCIEQRPTPRNPRPVRCWDRQYPRTG